MKKPNAVELNNDQKLALEVLKSDRNVFLTGSAGTGKSTLINYYKKHHNKQIQVLCSTGLASVLVGGRTFHSFFGIGIMNESLETILERVMSNPVMVARILRTKSILVDEVSMLPGKAIDVASLIAKTIRNDDRPFGGIRVIAVGDFYQLGPVAEYGQKTDWAFNSLTWEEADFAFVELKEFMRTKDEYFLKVLASVRKGLVGPEVTKFLNSKIISKDEMDSFVGTRIFSRKKMVQEYNEKKLAEIQSPLVSIKTRYTGDTNHVQRLKRNLPIEDELLIKVGAFVMVRVNDNSKNKAFVNGTLGHITDINGEYSITIKTLEGEYITLTKHTFELTDGDGNTLSLASNFAISLAFSITTHKSQGSTVNKAVVDLKNLFCSGLGYTALSRLTGSEGLKITGWDKKSIFVDKEVTEFYKKIRNQSGK